MNRIDYVRVYTPGSFVSDDQLVRVDGPASFPKEWPSRAYSFKRAWRYEGDGPDGKPMRGDLHYEGGETIVGEEFTLEQVSAAPWATGTLLTNMKMNGWDRIVRCAQGCLPLFADDVVVPRLPS